MEDKNGKLYIIAGCRNDAIQFFEWSKGIIGTVVPQFNRLVELEALKGTVMSMIVCDGLLYSGGDDSNICIVSIANPATPKIITYQKVNGRVSAMKHLKKSDKILIDDAIGLVKIYKANGFAEETWFALHKDVIVDVASIEDKNLFLVIDYRSFITSWQMSEQGAI